MPRVPFAFSHRELDADTCAIAIEGDLDVASAPRLKRCLMDQVGAGRDRLALDLSRVTFMDSTALGVLVGVKRTLGEDGIIVVAGATPAILKLFDVTGLDRRLDLFPTLDEALASLQQRPPSRPAQDAEARTAGAEWARVDSERVGGEAENFYDGADARTPLTGDAAVALGIAATAMPFALSKQAQAERWVRILRQYGDAAIVLTSVGFSDEPIEGEADREIERPTGGLSEGSPAEVVTRRARQIAGGHGGPTRTTDLLLAVMEVYQQELEQVLMRHEISSADLVERLGQAESGSDPHGENSR
jgi:anti-sigma B factor antagonist